MPLASWERLRETLTARNGSRGDEWLRICGLKGFVDGSLGSKTAAYAASLVISIAGDRYDYYVNRLFAVLRG